MKQLLFLILMLVCLSAFSQQGNFTYQFHNQTAKGGKFSFTDSSGTYSFDAPASAGYLGAANNPWFQLTKDVGPLPNGTWEIYAFKDEAKSILRLRPTSDVIMPTDDNGNPVRTGFLIHGMNENETPDQASQGCIILAPAYRKKLAAAFKKYGLLTLRVSNIVTGDVVN